MTGVMHSVVSKRGYLLRFQDGFENEMSSNQLTIVVVRIEIEEDIKVREVEMIPKVHEQLGCYHWVYISLHFIKDDGVYNIKEQVGVNRDPDEKQIKNVVLNDDREHHRSIFFEDNNRGVDGTKALLHAKKWYVYILLTDASVNGGYLVEVSDKYGKKLIWEVVDDHVVEEGVEHEELVL